MSAWIFDRRTDLFAFGGSFLASAALVAWGAISGTLEGPVPLWCWLAAIVGVDVAHVWCTAWRIYFDRAELARRPALYLGGPVVAYVAGVALHAHSSALFWRVLAYVAIFHFLRQQVGWVKIARRRAGDTSEPDRLLDLAAVHAAVLYPLVYWHTHLPRAFAWFVDGDLVALPANVDQPSRWLAALVLIAWLLRQIVRIARREAFSWGKQLIVVTTAACWFGGVVLTNGDYAFTVTNVLIHGVPYFVLVWRFGRARHAGAPGALGRVFSGVAIAFVLVPLAFAITEEALWDRFIWDDHAALFGAWGGVVRDGAATFLVPLLALPQAIHYLLDGYVWRTRDNPAVGAVFVVEANTDGARA